MGLACCQRLSARSTRRKQLLRGVAPSPGRLTENRAEQVADARTLGEGEGAVHIGFSRVKLRIDHQLGVECRIVQADMNRWPGTLPAKTMTATVCVRQLQAAIADEILEQSGQKLNGSSPV